MLTNDDVSFYREQGYVLVPNLVDAKLIDRARAVLQDLLNNAKNVAQSDDVYDLEPSHSSENPKVRRIKHPHLVDSVFMELARAPAMLGALQQLLGPTVRLHGSKINIKPPRVGSAVEWHQDWAAYPHTNDDILAVGVMLDDCLEENGPLLVVPGSHRGPVLDHHHEGSFIGAIAPDNPEIGYERAVALTGSAGAMSFHHVRLTHGSANNTSERFRSLLLYEFAAADAWPLSGVKDYE
ncbi:MAG: phytanoyl-CoA dioxygenase family protein [Pigmentiphaga sp.]